jgi:hypothetical protein
MHPNKLKQLLLARLKARKHANRESNNVELMLTICFLITGGYVISLLAMVLYYDYLVDTAPKPSLSVGEPFGKSDRVLRSN